MSMRITQTNSFLSSQNTVKHISNQNSSRVSLTDSKKISVSGINTDKGRGVDTANKKNELQKMMEEIKAAAEDYGHHITEVIEHSNSVGQKIADNIESSSAEIKKIREEVAADEKSVSAATERNKETGMAVSNNADINSEITESEVVVESSPEAKVAAYKFDVWV